MKIPVRQLVNLCKSQVGDKYIFGTEVSATDPNPEAFDCSELVEWAMERLGVNDFPDGSFNQRAHMKKIAIDQAIKTFGAVLGREPGALGAGTPGHIAISLGNGRSVEARGSAFGVGIFSATEGRVWTDGGLFPEIDYFAADDKPEMVRRAIAFGKHGGRFGSVELPGTPRIPQQLEEDLLEAERKTGAGVLIVRQEPKNLKVARDWPLWYEERKRK